MNWIYVDHFILNVYSKRNVNLVWSNVTEKSTFTWFLHKDYAEVCRDRITISCEYLYNVQKYLNF